MLHRRASFHELVTMFVPAEATAPVTKHNANVLVVLKPYPSLYPVVVKAPPFGGRHSRILAASMLSLPSGVAAEEVAAEHFTNPKSHPCLSLLSQL